MATTYKSTRKKNKEFTLSEADSTISLVEDSSLKYYTDSSNYLKGMLGINASITNEMDYIDITRKGLKKDSVVRVSQKLGISQEKMSSLLHMSARTFQRLNDNEPLDIYTTEQTIEMAKVIVKAHQVFEDEATAIQWLKSPLKVLGGVSPIDLFDTSFGVQMVLDVLGRIEQGVYS